MLRPHVKTTDALRLRTDRDGLVSFEYVIVAACIIIAVAAAFNAGASTTIANALTTCMNTLSSAVTTAVGG